MSSRTELSPWLASVYVTPNYRNMGIGSKLVLHAMNKAKREGIESLYLFTTDNEQFYARLGWKLLDREHYHYQHVSIMSVLLSNKS